MTNTQLSALPSSALIARLMEDETEAAERYRTKSKTRFVFENEARRIKQTLRQRGERICPACQGWGKQIVVLQPEVKDTCGKCLGLGVDKNKWNEYSYADCDACNGTKEIITQEYKSEIVPCETCHGEKIVKIELARWAKEIEYDKIK